MPYTPNGVVSNAFTFRDFMLTYFISGLTTEAEGDVVGRAVAIDATAANTVKLAGDGDAILGRVFSYEDRKQEGVKIVGIERKFVKRLPIKSGLTSDAVVAVGKTVIGAGAGEVKASGALSAANHTVNIVRELQTVDGVAYAVVEKL